VPAGALYYGEPRRRLEITFDPPLRTATQDAACRLHTLLAQPRLPQVPRQPHCANCSLQHLCLPGATSGQRSARVYFQRAVRAALASDVSQEADG